jgi:hypothetical protein
MIGAAGTFGKAGSFLFLRILAGAILRGGGMVN